MASKSSLFPSGWEWRFVLTGTCFFAAGVLARSIVSKSKAYIQRSPRATLLPTLSESEKAQLPYPPDVLPGVRDVDTPFGSIRVYEFGPEDGRKVLLVHGISTPAIALGAVAHALADNGCRVMLFDLFGRGYSDNPGDLKHDIRLFTTQILLALASSPLSWTGSSSGKFSMIGYSLGGGIAATFASYFPNLVDSLILFAPAGLLRPHHISKTSHIIYSEGIIPESILQTLVQRRLRTPMAAPLKGAEKNKIVDATEAVQAEVNLESNPPAVLSKTRPHVTVEKTVIDQLDNHVGFVPAFMSSIRYGPVRDQHDRWRIIGNRLTRENNEKNTQKKVLIVCGANDPIIVRQEIEEDAKEVLLGNAEFVVFEAGHEVPISKSEQVVASIMDFWKRTD
ncbi:uncharacterized protein Z518_04959 [Rhinocladiella mackenziei CBS 650.93]|uniref:AB hydrolase-1 domain-containing protein n=1 Tax=Rhinocladiella mackenziei CBS 650.93 TaxID=1442369 RepID=A0A0D2H940_9EURO|nr:uncharacterized protein Z518_04959 [Rhinocladiella mackenziei CBS 650.93]KIX06983.1 hypothetical protein Z518_04959 [Rhinocladiella mackenziei CBS 650.93]